MRGKAKKKERNYKEEGNIYSEEETRLWRTLVEEREGKRLEAEVAGEKREERQRGSRGWRANRAV